MSFKLVMPSNQLILSRPYLPALSLSQNKDLFQCVISLHQAAKVLKQLQHQSFQWVFRVGTLKSLLQHNSKASILWYSAFFVVQLSHQYMTTGKTIALTLQTTISKVMSLLSNMFSRFVVTFLPRTKYLLISWLQSPSKLILEPKKIKHYCSHFSISIKI